MQLDQDDNYAFEISEIKDKKQHKNKIHNLELKTFSSSKGISKDELQRMMEDIDLTIEPESPIYITRQCNLFFKSEFHKKMIFKKKVYFQK